MQIVGEWFLCDDGMTRPVIRGEVETARATWEPVIFLLDTGADRTVFSAAVLAMLGFEPTGAPERIGGLGGVIESAVVQTRIRLRDEAGPVVFRGVYAACIDLESLDMSVLGRDILDLFAVIVDRPDNHLCLLRQRHRYVIVSQ